VTASVPMDCANALSILAGYRKDSENKKRYKISRRLNLRFEELPCNCGIAIFPAEADCHESARISRKELQCR
jgi:hypothetical protein